MGRGDKIDIVTTYRLKAKHTSGKLFSGESLSLPQMTDLKVLTVEASKTAVR